MTITLAEKASGCTRTETAMRKWGTSWNSSRLPNSAVCRCLSSRVSLDTPASSCIHAT